MANSPEDIATFPGKMVEKIGPRAMECVKCGPSGSFIESSLGIGVTLMKDDQRYDARIRTKTCKRCGFTELYCPDAIEDE